MRHLNELLKRRAVPLALATMFLSGCVTAGSCESLTVHEYGDLFSMRFAVELSNIPEDSATSQFIVDAVELRDSVRACKGA
jgi:hypothetical protein